MNRSRASQLNFKHFVAVFALTAIVGIQQVNAQANFALEEIIVTSRKVEEGLQNAPIAVSAFTATELENRGAIDVTDIASASPNVHFQTGGSTSGMSAAPTVFIRGIGQSDFNVNNDPAVGMNIDGIYLGRMIGSLTDLLDLERAEVLRGPQGTLFGRNSIGGAINLITKKPDTEAPLSGDLSLAFGERGYSFIKGSANIPLSDIAAARISGFVRERDGYVDAVQYDDLELGGEDVWGLRAALRIDDASENFTIDLAVDISERRDPPAAVVPLQLGNVSANPGSGNVPGDNRSSFASGFRFNTGLAHYGAAPLPLPNAAFISTDTVTCSNQALVNTSTDCFGNAHIQGVTGVNSIWVDREGNTIVPEQALDVAGLSAVMTWDTGIGTLVSTTSYRDMEARFNNDNDFTPFIIFHNLNDEFTQDQFSQELQLSGSASDSLDYIVGLYYFKEEADQRVSLVAPLLPPAGAPPAQATLPFFQTIDRGVENSSQAIYGQLIYSINDALELTTGLRYTESDKEIDLNLFRGNEASPFFTLSRDDAQENEEVNILVNLAWNVNDNLMVYGQYSDGFRDGGWPVRFPGLPAAIPPLDTVEFGTETVDAFEVGLKSTLLDGALRLNAAIFTTNYENMQIEFSDPTLNGAPNTSNIGEASISGLEVELNWVASDNLRFDLSAGLLDAKLDSITGGLVVAGADNTRTTITTSNTLPYTPDLQLALGVNHTFELSGGSYVRSRIDWIYTDDQFYTIENSMRNFQESYSVVNANISYVAPGEKWEVTLGARNLTDETYFTSSRTQADSSSVFASLARPSEVYLQARYRFGNE